MTGIYYITHIDSNKRYVGSSKDIDDRWSEHKCDLKNNHHINQKLQRAWNKYSAEAFKFEIEKILPDTLTKEELLAYEQPYLDAAKANPDMWYNISYIATRPDHTGIKHSEETKARISKAKKGVKHGPLSEETKLKLSKAKKGVKHGPMSAEARLNMSKAFKGRKYGPRSEEWKRKQSIAHTGIKLGPHSEETKLKISEANKGKKRTEEAKLKMSRSQTGKKASTSTSHRQIQDMNTLLILTKISRVI